MKKIFIILALFSAFSCSNDPSDEIKPVNPEIHLLSKAYVGTWNLIDFTTPYNEGNVVLGNMPDYISYNEACKSLTELSIPIKLTKSYTITYSNNVLNVDRTSVCDNTIEHLVWEIELQDFSSTNSPVQYTEHQFKILEKNSDGILLRTYDVIQFNLDKESLREYNIPKYSFQVHSEFDTYNSYVPYPSVAIIRYNKKGA